MIPINTFLAAYIAIYVASFTLSVLIDRLNIKHLETHGRKVPDAFIGMIDESELIKIHRYSKDNIHFKIFESSMGKVFFLFIILSGILPWLRSSQAAPENQVPPRAQGRAPTCKDYAVSVPGYR